MYTKKNYSVKDMALWTRQDTVLLVCIALVPVVVYQVLDQKWLHLPWLPIAVVGTAVALVMWVFHTMERIGRVSENPFEGTPNDVPITTISRGIEIDLREMLDDDPSSIPPPIENQHDAQT
jgi:predicted membrane chloride channel (bestrophin family)